MPLIHDPNHAFTDPDHPFYKPAILFAPKQPTSSNPNSSPKDLNQPAGAPSEEPLTGMDEPRWMKSAQDKIDQDALEHFQRIGKIQSTPKQ